MNEYGAHVVIVNVKDSIIPVQRYDFDSLINGNYKPAKILRMSLNILFNLRSNSRDRIVWFQWWC